MLTMFAHRVCRLVQKFYTQVCTNVRRYTAETWQISNMATFTNNTQYAHNDVAGSHPVHYCCRTRFNGTFSTNRRHRFFANFSL